MNLDELRSKKSVKLLELQRLNAENDNRTGERRRELATEVAALEGQIANLLKQDDRHEDAAINQVSQASCLEMARRYEEARRIYVQVRDTTQNNRLRIWIDDHLNYLESTLTFGEWSVMHAFDLRDRLIEDYSRFVRSFINICDKRIAEYVNRELQDGALWPEPLVQLNPAFEPGETVDELVNLGVIHPECGRIFRIKDNPNEQGRPLRLHRHQADAVKIAIQGRDYVLTTGTGSGKSLAYLIPVVNHVLQNGPRRGIQAVIVYPMNALANSQVGELEKFINFGYPDQRGPITFRRYTGQESDDEKNEIIANPPDILLTNYVMLELLLTRPQEANLVRAARGLRFLILDELHTYRGRQGADVAMLVRRTREAVGAQNLQCVGTSATLASAGSWDEQRVEVSKAASLLFGSTVHPENIIGESLKRITADENTEIPEFIDRLRTRLGNNPSTNFNSFVYDPLAIWIETTLGVTREQQSCRLVRQTPSSIRGANGVAAQLAEKTGVEYDRCVGSIQNTLIAGFKLPHPDTGLPVFAFRIHQFISRGDTVYASPESETLRYVTLQGQQFVPNDRNRVLLPLVFCRECGQEYYSVWRRDVSERATVQFTPRDFTDRAAEEDVDAGYIYISGESAWPDEGSEEFLRRLPDDWVDEAGRVIQRRREYLPQAIRVQPNGELGLAGIAAWFIPAPFRFCLHCGVSYGFRQRSDFQKLSALGSEGRSTATTILSLSVIRHLKEFPIHQTAKKLLSFTDNRQDASLQAGHFNDFVELGLLRSTLYRAAQASGDSGLSHDQLAQKVFDALALPFDRYAQDATLRGLAREETHRVLRDVLGYRIYRDLKRGWRIMAPNLEQVGLLKIEYPYLFEACHDTEIWSNCHPALANASPKSRCEITSVLLDFMRRELAVKVDYLTQPYQEGLLQRSRQRLQPPWGLDENEQVRDMVHSSVLYPRARRQNDYGGDIFLSSQSGYGLYLRRSPVAREHGHRLTLVETERILRELLDRLRLHGLVEVVREATPGGNDPPGYQINAAAMVWKAGDGTQGYHDPIRRPTESDQGTQANEFFVEYYRSLDQEKLGIEAREHTAQVPYAQREEREAKFREGSLPILFCSPTMELGIDIAQLNTVNMRNVPPTPANYAQRSGRAGRSGQPALVFTYCSAGSPHDQYFFKRPEQMVAGAVSPPQVDLTNEDLIRAHIHAVWLAEAGLSLGTSLKDLLDVRGDDPSMTLLDQVRDAVNAKSPKRRTEERALIILESIQEQLVQSDWYTPDWLHEVVSHIPIRFEQACDRWRNLYLSALRQAQKQDRVIRDASRPAADRAQAEQLRKNAEAQLRLLTESQNLIQSDFYSYRYFASEGFLPGYNFPRLPLSAYIPGRRFRRGKDEFLSRPRFLAISEFGPRSIIYHEGSRYIINQVILPARDTEELHTSAAKVCQTCGYLHPYADTHPRDLCERCGTELPALIRQLFRLENVVTKRRDQINCDEEERLRLGYELKTVVRFAERGGQPSYRIAKVKCRDQEVASLYFGNAATLWRINLGWARRRRDRDQHGFVLDIERGYWQRHQADLDQDGDPMTPKTARVIPYVEDRKNCLIVEFLLRLDESVMATLQAAIKNAIQTCYELESSELAAEPLPDRDNRRAILFYEAAEGGAGVLRRVVDDLSAVPRIARTALDLCHFSPDTGEDLRRAPNAKENCEAACYDCLMSYTNQMDHQLLDRHLIKDLLMDLSTCNVEISPAPRPRTAHLQGLFNLTNSQLERDWLQFLEDRDLRLPSHSQTLVAECRTRPDFLYKDQQVAVYVDGPPHDYPDRQERDGEQTNCMEDAGWTVIRFSHRDDWESVIERFPNIFGDGS
jgi:ATP-dependent helicase YprA (DUF1998 family)/very-short-patch-repair endonuclease